MSRTAREKGIQPMPIDSRRLDVLRAGATEVENHYIDELVAGRLNRRDFLRRGSMIGMSAPLLGAVLAIGLAYVDYFWALAEGRPVCGRGTAAGLVCGLALLAAYLLKDDQGLIP